MSASLAGLVKKHLAPLEERIAALERKVMDQPFPDEDAPKQEEPAKKPKKKPRKTYGTE